jgi:hypothetical protein
MPSIDAVIDTKSVKFCKISLRQSRIVVYAAAHLGEVAMPSIDVLCSHEEALVFPRKAGRSSGTGAYSMPRFPFTTTRRPRT